MQNRLDGARAIYRSQVCEVMLADRALSCNESLSTRNADTAASCPSVHVPYVHENPVFLGVRGPGG